MILTQKNEQRCSETSVVHSIHLPSCCPVSNNPLRGSMIHIEYTPKESILEVYSLKKYIDSYKGGKGEIRSMEGMIQAITKDCAVTIGVTVAITAELKLHPDQSMTLKTIHKI